MSFNIKKYIIMVCIGVLLTAFCIPVLNANWDTNADSNAEVETPVVPEEPTPEDTTVKVPTFNNAISAWAYGIDMLNNGKGYSITSTTVAKGSVYGVEQAQEITYTSSFDGENYYEDTKTYCATDLGKTFARQAYMNKDNKVFYRYTESCNKSGGSANKLVANWDDNDLQTMSYDQFLTDVSMVGFSSFNFEINKSCNIVYFKNMNKEYYEYQISVPQNLLYDTYKENFVKNAGAKAITFKTFVLTVYQSKKTGKFLSIIKDEAYNLTEPLGLPVTLVTSSVTRYSNIIMNSDSVTITPPFSVN